MLFRSTPELGKIGRADVARKQRECLDLPKPRLALVVDQLEELFTSGFSPEVRQKYVSALAGLVRSSRVFVLATLRSDFYASYQELPDLIELSKPSGKFYLLPPTPSEIGNMIQLPAEAAGLHFEQDRRRVNALMTRCATLPLPHRNRYRYSSMCCPCSTTSRTAGVMACCAGRIIANWGN